MAPNTGVVDPPEPQGYDLALDPDGTPYDPFGDGTKVYHCSACEAVWNADDLHLEDCARLTVHASCQPLPDGPEVTT